MRNPWKNPAVKVLALAAALLLAEGTLFADSVRIKATFQIGSSSEKSTSISTRPRHGGDREDGNRPRARRRNDSFLLCAPVIRRNSSVGQVVHLTGNGQLNMTRSRTYVKGYTVENGFLLPVIGTTRDGVKFGVSDGDDERDRSAPDYLLRDPRLVAASRPQPAPSPEPTIVVERGPIGIHTTSLVGTLKQTEDGELEFMADALNDGPVQYDLVWPEPARKVLADAGTEALRIILVGKVNDEDPRPVIRVTAAYALSTPAD